MSSSATDLLRGASILVVDDEPGVREILTFELSYQGCVTYEAENIEDAWNVIENHHVDVVISDMRMPKGSGHDLIKKIKAAGLPTKIIIITGFSDTKAAALKETGASHVLSKPIDLAAIIDMISELLHVDQSA